MMHGAGMHRMHSAFECQPKEFFEIYGRNDRVCQVYMVSEAARGSYSKE